MIVISILRSDVYSIAMTIDGSQR